jgi:prepilin-type N-terminal cleavage/methylation domain-containing protein
MTMHATFKRHKARREAGFSLIEVLVALLILAGALLAVAKFQVNLVGSNSLAKQRSEAAMLAQAQIESMRAYATIAAYNGLGSNSDTVNGTSASFARNWTVTNNTSYIQVTSSVTWADSTGTNQTVTLQTDIAKNDPSLTAQLIVTPTSTTSTSSSSTSTTTTSIGSGTTTTTTGPTTSTTTSTTTTSTTLRTLTISGTVSLGSPSPASSLASLSLSVNSTSGAATCGSIDPSSGTYSCSVSYNWSGTIQLQLGANYANSGDHDCVQNPQGTAAQYSGVSVNYSGVNHVVTKRNKGCPDSSYQSIF